jgi:hypothetical protein
MMQKAKISHGVKKVNGIMGKKIYRVSIVRGQWLTRLEPELIPSCQKSKSDEKMLANKRGSGEVGGV